MEDTVEDEEDREMDDKKKDGAENDEERVDDTLPTGKLALLGTQKFCR